METLLPRLIIPEEGSVDPARLFPEPKQAYWLEIGFGGGEHLAAQAERHPECGLIGCEVFTNGVAKALVHIDVQKLENIRLYTEDVRSLLERLPNYSLHRVFILFPDPWPKKRHYKRRLINADLLKELHRVLVSGGALRIATDHRDYLTWILAHMVKTPLFKWAAGRSEDWKKAPADHITTRYEAKAIRQGRIPTYLDYRAA